MSDQPETTNSDTHSSQQPFGLGSRIILTQENSTVYIAPEGGPGETVYLVVSGTPPQGAISTFVITACEYDGGQTKVSLQPLTMDGYYWVPGQNVADQAYPVILGTTPETFILNKMLEGFFIQTAFSPQGSYVQGSGSGTQVLTYGHDQPFNQGVFGLRIVS